MDQRFPAHLWPPAVFGWKSLSSRVFFENGSEEMICEVWKGLPNVMVSKTFNIPDPSPSIFNLPNTFWPKPHSWVRLNRSIYKGDIAFIWSIDVYSTILINVLMVPCIAYDPPSTKAKGSWLIANEDQNDQMDDEFTAFYKPNHELTEELLHQGDLPKPCSIQLWQSNDFVGHFKSEMPCLYSEACSTMPMDMHISRILTLIGIWQKMWYQTWGNLNFLVPVRIFLSMSDSTQWRECQPGSFR